MSTEDPNEALSGDRLVRLVFLRRDSDQQPLDDWLIEIHAKSTFRDIQEGLVPKYQDQFTVLRTTFGPVPYWTKPEPDSYIGEFCQTLYAVNKEEEYVLALVRTAVNDYPLALKYHSLKNGSTLLDVVTLAAPELNSARITGYSAALTDNAVDCIEEQKDKLHFPTVFIITTDDRPDEFEFDLEPAPKIPAFELGYLDANYLQRKSYGVKHCPLQMVHVSRALIHAVVSLSKLVDAPLDSVNVDAKNLEDVVSPTLRVEKSGIEASEWYYPYKMAAFEASSNLNRLYDDLAEILKELDSDSIVPVPKGREGGGGHPAEPRIEKVFFDLCGEHPGAVAIRESYARFKQLKRWDEELEEEREEERQEERKEEMRRLAQRPSFGLSSRLLKYLWYILPTWGEQPPSPPPPSGRRDTNSQDLPMEPLPWPQEPELATHTPSL